MTETTGPPNRGNINDACGQDPGEHRESKRVSREREDPTFRDERWAVKVQPPFTFAAWEWSFDS